MFLVCPKCYAAMPENPFDGPYVCRACHHHWTSPHHLLSPAYFAEIQDLSLSLVSGNSNGERFVLPPLPATIGRDSDCRALQSNLSVSRKHCELHYDSEHHVFEIVDFGRAGGTAINGTPVPPGGRATIMPGDELVLAGTPLSFDVALRRDKLLEAREASFGLKSPIDVSNLKRLSFIRDDGEGSPSLCDGYDEPGGVIGAICPTGAAEHPMLIVLNRELIKVNGEVVIEHTLKPGDQVWLLGGYFTFSPSKMKLVPHAPPGGPKISLIDVGVQYGKRQVLNGIACTIPGTGKLTAVLGPSGSGKSTLLKVLSGMRSPDTGVLAVNDEHVAYSEWSHRYVAQVPQHDVVHGELTVGECLTYVAKLDAHRCGTSVEDRVHKALQDTLLDKLEERRIDELSGGQRKRVNVACALTASPSVLLLDEPTSGLDSTTESAVVAVLRRLARQGRTVVFATHSQAAVDMADHVIVLMVGGEGAQVVAEGSPENVKSKMSSADWSEVFSRIAHADPGSVGQSIHRDIRVRTRDWGFRIPTSVTLALRYAAIWLSNPLAAGGTLLALPLILGLLIWLAVAEDSDGKSRILFGVVAAFWIGMNQSVREIVKERAIFLHEQARGATCIPYLLSKVLFFVIVATLQAMLLAMPLTLIPSVVSWISKEISCPWYVPMTAKMLCPWYMLMGGLWLGIVLGCSVGLLISTGCLFLKRKGEVAAVMLVVLVTLPQILFSDKELPFGLRGPEHVPEVSYSFEHAYKPGQAGAVPELLSYFTFSRYLFLPLDISSEYATIQKYQGSAIRSESDFMLLRRTLVFNLVLLSASCLTVLLLSWIGLECYVALQRRRL